MALLATTKAGDVLLILEGEGGCIIGLMGRGISSKVSNGSDSGRGIPWVGTNWICTLHKAADWAINYVFKVWESVNNLEVPG